MADIKPTYTENHDHGLLISLVHRMIGAIDKGIGIRRAKKVALTGEIAAEENTKLLGLGIDINHAANYDAKVELLKEINKELFQLEKRRERLYMWIRYMKTLDNEVTLQNKNQAEYQQQHLALQQQQQQLYLQFLAALKEEMPSLLEDCRNIIDVLTREIKEHKEMIEAVQEVMNDVAEIHNAALETIKDIEKHGKEIDAEITELDELKKTASPKYYETIDEFKRTLEHDKEIFHDMDTDAREIAEDAHPDGQMAQALKSHLHAAEEKLHADESMVAAVEDIEARVKQMAVLTPTEIAAKVAAQPDGRLPEELNVQDLVMGLKEISGAAAAAQREKMTAGVSGEVASASLEAASTVNHGTAAQFKALQTGKLAENIIDLPKQISAAIMQKKYYINLGRTAVKAHDDAQIQSTKEKVRALEHTIKQLKMQYLETITGAKQMKNFCTAAESTAVPLDIPATVRDATLSAAAQGQELSGSSAMLTGHDLHKAHWPPLAKSVTDHGQSADPKQQPFPNAGPNKRS